MRPSSMRSRGRQTAVPGARPQRAASMNQKRRSPRGPPHSESLDSEPSQTNADSHSYLEPWILNLLLEYKENDAREEGQLGHILKVLKESRGLHHDGQGPAAVMHVGDGRCYIQVFVTAKATRISKCSLPQSGFSSILGHFITLQDYRVCFKEAAKVEECRFYLMLDCFSIMPMKRPRMSQQDCNREPSVVQKIKELWQRSFALQSCPSSEPSSVSEVLREIKQNQLSTLKQNVETCLSLLDPEQLAAYPDTKWQVERERDEMHQDIFTVPGKFLAISEDNEVAVCKSCSSKPSLAVLDTDENGQDDELSTLSFFSADSESVGDFPANPWDVFPGMSLTSSSEMSDTPSRLPHVQQLRFATTAEEEMAAHSNSCTPDFLESHDLMPHCSSAQAEPLERRTPSPSLLPSHSNASLQELAGQESRLAVHHTSKISDTDESIPCGQRLRNSHSEANMRLLSSVHSTYGNDLSLGPLSENTTEDNLTRLQGHKMVGKAGENFLENSRKRSVAKRKRMVSDEEEPTSSSPTSVSQKALHQPSPMVFPKHSKPDRQLVAWKPPLEFVSTPKKSRVQETRVQQPQQVSAQLRRSERLLGRERKQVATEAATGRPGDCCCDQLGSPQQECMTISSFDFTIKPPTPEVCTQVRSTRISRALLGWACWVFSNPQEQ